MSTAYGTPRTNGRTPREDANLRTLWNFALRNRWLTFGVPALMIAATTAFVFIVEPTYQASAWIRVDDQQSSVPVLEALQSISAGSAIETEMEVLRRRPVSETVVDSLGLQLDVVEPRGVRRSELFSSIDVGRDAPEATYRFRRLDGGEFAVSRDGEAGEQSFGRAAPGDAVRLAGAVVRLAPESAAHEEIVIAVGRFESAVKAFRETIGIRRPNREADVVAIRYEGQDPELVRAVPNALARQFIAQRQDVRKTEARSTVGFLGEQIDTISDQLQTAERGLRAFRERTNLVDLETEAETQLGRLAQLQAERDRLDAEREALAGLLQEVRDSAQGHEPGDESPYRRLIAFPSLLENFAVSELFRSLAEVENSRAELLNRRTMNDPDVQVLTQRIRELENQLRNISLTYLDGLTRQVNSIEAQLDRFRGELAQVPAKEIQFLRMKRTSTVLEEIYTMLQTRLKEAQIAAAVEDPSIRVVEPAILPREPIKPNKRLSLFLALVLGLVLGGGAAFARENLDDKVRTRDDLSLLTADAPILGLIPKIDGDGRREPAPAPAGGRELPERLVAGRDPRSPVAEAYRTLRTNLTFSRPERTPTSVVFASPTPGDGKSTTAANIAITLAQQDARCLLIDADMRRGQLNEAFGTSRQPGLSNVILGRVELHDAVHRIDLGESGELDFLATGTLPPNPAELLGAESTRSLLERLEAEYDAVIIDAPPLNLVTDAALLGSYTDGVILVTRSGVTERGAVDYALEQLERVRAPLLGTLLNDIDVKENRYYGSYSAGAHAEYYGTIGEQ